MKKHYSIFVWGLGAILLAQPTLAQQKATIKKPITAQKTTSVTIPQDAAVKIGRLPNGLTYYIRKNTEPKNRAELYLANRIGSLMENDAQQGLAHFTEHMAFNGTKDFPKNEIINFLQKAGVRFGADLNAYTSFNETVYQLPIPTDSIKVFETGFKILANWAGKVSMDSTDIDSERGVIIEEDRQTGKNAQQRMINKLLPVLLSNSQYAKRVPIGKVDILNTFTYDKIRSFYADWYRPNLQAVIAVGDFDINKVEALIKANFSDLANPKIPKPREAFDLPDNAKPLVKIVTDKEQPYNVVQIIYKHRQEPIKTTADYKKSFIYSLINSMLSARFREINQKGNAPFIAAGSSYSPYQGGMVWGINAFQTFAVSKDGTDLKKAFTAALAENERMAQYGFTLGELETVKKQMSSSIEKQYKEKDKTESTVYVDQYLQNFLTGKAIIPSDYRYNECKKLIQLVTLSEVNALAKKLITNNNQVIIVQAPEKEAANIPTEPQLLTALKDAGKGLKPYVDNTVNKPLLAKIPTAGNIVKEEKNEKIGVTTLTLSNGVKVLLKHTDFKNDQILFYSFAKGGSSLANNNDYQSAQNANLIAQSGVGDFNPTQLTKKLADKYVAAGAYIDDLYQGFSGSSPPKDLETVFQLIYAYATNPRKDVEIFNKNINDYKVVIANKNSSPNSVFADTVQAVMANYNKRGMPTTLANLDQISLDKAFAFYKERFADASGQTFVFVGNFEVEKIKPYLATYLASLPTLNKNENFKDNGVNPPNGKVNKTVYKGIEDKANIQLHFHGDYDYNTTNNMLLEALKSTLEIKTLERLREKESGVYSPSVSLSVSKYPKAHYYVSIYFSCAKANVDKLINAALDEVSKVTKNGATEDDLKKYKAEEMRQGELNLRENGFWLNYLSNSIKYGDDVDQLTTNKELINSITIEQTKVAAQKLPQRR